MNHASPPGRARLRESLRNTLALMERAGVPRDVLLDVLESVLAVERAEKPKSAPQKQRVEIDELSPGDPDMEEAKRKSADGFALLTPVLEEIAQKHGIDTAISACVSQLAYMLIEIRKSGPAGHAVADSALIGLQRVLETRENAVMSITMKAQH